MMTSRLKQIAALVLSIACVTVFTQTQADEQPEKKRTQPDCKNCPLAKADKTPAPREAGQKRPRPDRPDQQGRPLRPPQSLNTRDLPPETRKFVERVRGFHQEIGKLHREGKHEAAHDIQQKLHEFIKDHADLARRAGPAIHSPKDGPDRGRSPEHNRPGRRPPSPKADIEHVRNELRKAQKDGRGEDAEKLRRHLGEIERHHARRGDQANDEAHDLERQIHHLHTAAKNLEQAGLGEAADKILQQAEDMENEFRERREREQKHHQERQIDRQEKQIDHQERQIDSHEKQLDSQEKQIDHLTKEIEHLKAELRKKGKK